MLLREVMKIKLGDGGSQKKLDNFMEDYIISSQEHPWNPRVRIIDNTMIELSPFGGKIHISDIVAIQPQSGFATSAMKKLQNLADKYGVELELTAKAYSQDGQRISDTEKLIKWYLKLGFKIQDDLVDDPDDLEGIEQVDMVYYPK